MFLDHLNLVHLRKGIEDKIYCAPSKHGLFDVKSIYMTLIHSLRRPSVGSRHWGIYRSSIFVLGGSGLWIVVRFVSIRLGYALPCGIFGVLEREVVCYGVYREQETTRA